MSISTSGAHGFRAFWEVLASRAERQPERRAFTFLADGEREAAHLSYLELDCRARALAVGLLKRAGPGERAILLLPPGPDFVVAFLGCLHAGVVAVPAYPPRSGRGARDRGGGRLRAMFEDCRPRLALVSSLTASRLSGPLSGAQGPPETLLVDDVSLSESRRWSPPATDPDDVAFLQYTSGSTASPRGVEVTHRNLLANERAIEDAFDQSRESVVVGWLPVYHDMGLIGNLLQPIWSGGSCVLMSPASFLQRPRRWLEAIDRYRATTSGGPDFSYDLTVRRVPPEDRRGLDLSCWRVAYNGAEPVRATTLERFAEAFAGCGFRRAALFPCYGLAEATLFVTGGSVTEAPSVRSLAADALEAGRAVEARQRGTGDGEGGPSRRRTLVSCGRAAAGADLRVVDPERATPLPPGTIGEIWVAGEGVARGYFRRPAETAETFGARLAGDSGSAGAPWLRTGDLGFLDPDGELFVTGRSKDVILVRGRNLYPQDLEHTAQESHDAVRRAGAAAFPLEGGDGERPALAFEMEPRRHGEAQTAAAAVRDAVAVEHLVTPAVVVALRAGRLPRTSSGKVRRSECRRRYEAGELDPLAVLEPARDMESGAPGAEETAGEPAAEDLLAARADSRLRAAEAYLVEVVGRILRLPRDGTDPGAVASDRDRPLPVDSLQAMELHHRVAADLGVELPLGLLLEGRSLPELARSLAERLPERGDASGAGLRVASRPPGRAADETPFPVTWNQRALWFLERVREDEGWKSALTVAFAARIERSDGPRGAPEPEELRRAILALIERHTALRTVYPADPEMPDRPRARVLSPPHPEEAETVLDFGVLPLPPEAETAQGALGAVRELLAREAVRPFDLDRGPLVRARVVPPSEGPEGGTDGPTLLLVVHHVAIDLWSLEVLLGDLERQLRRPGPRPGTPARDLAPDRGSESASFAAFARWQEERLALTGPAGEGGALRDFWRGELDGAPTALELPADRPRPPVFRPAGARLPIDLPPQAEASARALADRALRNRRGATLFAVLLSGLGALLGRLTGRDDLLLGSPAAGRPGTAFEGTVGYFANLLPLRIDLSGDPSFDALLERTRRRLAGALDHQDLPFPLIVEDVAPPRDRSRHPLVQAGLVLERPHRLRRPEAAPFVLGREGASLDLGSIRLEAVELERRTVQLDLLLSASEAEGTLALAFDYATDLFDQTTVARWARSFGVLLEAASAAPERLLSELPVLSHSERFQVLVEWNDTVRPDRSEDRTVHALVADQAECRPDAVALVWEEAGEPPRLLTYGALREAAGRLAHRLRAAGGGPERAVAVALDRSPELIVTLLAVLESGSFYVPLDPQSPPARLAAVTAAVRPAAIVTRGAPPVRPEGASLIDLAAPAAAHADSGEARPPAEPVPPTALAYVVFTSGSTGGPKGVAVSHRAVVRRVDRPGYVRLDPGKAVLQLAPVSFDASTFEVWGALAAGARLVIAPPPPVSTDLLGRSLARHRVTTLFLTAGLFHLIMDERPDALSSPHGSLEELLSGGEVLSPERVRRALAGVRGRRLRVSDVYGPTEATTFASLHPMDSPAEVPAPIPIGRPISDTRMVIADRRLRPVAPGTPGELLIGGEGLARGYHGRPGQTAARFVPDPFAGRLAPAGARLYRTGDLARHSRQGEVCFLGRLDSQVKVRGFRVELEEVERALLRVPGVRAAVVSHRGDGLAAHFVPEPSPEDGSEGPLPDAAALRRALNGELPSYMVPGTFTSLDALPLGPTGKVDRAALPEPSGPEPDTAPGGRRRPRSELERTLTRLWAEVLELEPEAIDPEASFFDLGGHSLQMMRLHARVRETVRGAGDLPIVELFDHPSVAALAACLERRPEGGAAAPSARERASRQAEDTAGARAEDRRAAMRRRRAARRALDDGERDR